MASHFASSLFASLPQLWSTITQPLEALVTLQGKEDGKYVYMYISGVPRIFQVVSTILLNLPLFVGL